MIHLGQTQLVTQRAWLKPVGRALLAIIIGIYGQMVIAIPLWYAFGTPEEPVLAVELVVKVAVLAAECVVLLLLAMDKESIRKYVNLRSPRRILLLGLAAAVPLVAANRISHGWDIRLIHGDFAFYLRLTGSYPGAGLFFALQLSYYFFEAYVLVYAYAKLAEGLRFWRPMPRWVVILIGALFLFITWSLAHGFVLSSPIYFAIGFYLPFIFAALYDLTDSQVAPLIAWFLFLFV